MLYAIIMAGGTGTRFWPASRAATPKQLLPMVGDKTMIRQTVDRLDGLIAPKQTLIVTNERLIGPIAEQLPEIPAASIVGEPCKRDTAPCIGLAALLVSRDDPNATMAVMPADHVIRATDKFQAAMTQAAAMIEREPNRIVTFGIRPTYPAESFGYIQRGEPASAGRSSAGGLSAGGSPAYQVKQFQEKPATATAAKYLAAGDTYWNSGIFVWRAKTILDALAKRQAETLARLEIIVDAWDTDRQHDVFTKEFTAIEGISIDYAVMEHATNVVVIEAPFDWDDLGGWQSLTRLLGTDDNRNTIVGKHLGLGTTGSIVRTSDDHLVVTLGLEDTIVVHTPKATLVANKNDEESIRKIVEQLEANGWTEYL